MTPPPPQSYTSALPSTGHDILLVGRADLTRPLAGAILSVGFDSRRREGARKRRRGADADADASADASADEEAEGGTGGSSPPRRRSAIEALRRRLGGPRGEGAAPPSLSGALRARHVGLVDSLPPPPPPRKGEGTEEDRDRKSDSDSDPDPRGSSSSSSSSSYSPTGPARVDHAVLVLDPADPMSLPRLAEAAAALHPDYALGGRVTIVLAAPPGGGGVGPDPDLARALAQVERGGGGGNPTPTPTPVVLPPLFASSPVPVLPTDLGDRQGLLAVARMVLQRCRLGSRACPGIDDGLDAIGTAAAVRLMAEAGGTGGGRGATTGAGAGAGAAAGAASVHPGALPPGRGGVSPLFFSSLA